MEKKNKALNYFIWFVIFLIVAVGVWMFVSDNSIDEPTPYSIYNGYVIYEIKDDKSLRYNVQIYANDGKEYLHIFKNYPENLLSLDYEKNLRNLILYKDDILKKDKIYVSYNPIMDGSEILSVGTLIQILGTGNAGVFKIPVVVSVTEDNQNPDFPIKTCDDATKEVGVIELRYGEPRIYSEGECVVLQGSNREDFINNADLLSYMILEVIE